NDRIPFGIVYRMIKFKFLPHTNDGGWKIFERRTAVAGFHRLRRDFHKIRRPDVSGIDNVGNRIVPATSLVNNIITLFSRPLTKIYLKLVPSPFHTKT